jgi:plastocyanin
MMQRLEATMWKLASRILLILCLCGPVWPQDLTVTGKVTVLAGASKAEHADGSDVVIWLLPLDTGAAHREGADHRGESSRFRIVQKQKRFAPHLLVVPVGAAVQFPNLDPFFHNVFSLFDGKRFDLGLYEAGSTRAVRFDRPGTCYIFCNIHPEMSAVVLVLDTPFYGISNASGEIQISGVPPGRYLLKVWYERCSAMTLSSLGHEITVSGNSASLGVIHVAASDNLLLVHKNKYGRDYDNPTPSGPLYGQP